MVDVIWEGDNLDWEKEGILKSKEEYKTMYKEYIAQHYMSLSLVDEVVEHDNC